MASLDIVIVILVLLSAGIGLVRGLVKEILSLVSWVLAFVVALMFHPTLAQELPASWGGASLRLAIAFVLVFIATLIAAGVVQWLTAQLVRTTGLTGTDRFLGFLFGSVRGVLVVMVVLIGLREVAGEARWYQDARLPEELLAFEDEVRELFGRARQAVMDEDWQQHLKRQQERF